MPTKGEGVFPPFLLSPFLSGKREHDGDSEPGKTHGLKLPVEGGKATG